MKREDLKALGLEDGVIDSVMALHGKDIESHKGKLTAAEESAKTLQTQLTEANKQIEDFKGLDIDGVKKAADDWKAKAEQAQAEAAANLANLKFDHALESALTGAKAKNPKAVTALLSRDLLKLNEADGSISGLSEQLEKIKTDNDYLFESETPAPKIVTGGKSKSVVGDPVIDAARKAAGLTPQT